MEMRELSWFVELARTGTVTKAAVNLHITQPTLSRTIARLERGIGVKLFDRVQNRLRLNRYGEIYLQAAEEAIAAMERAESEITGLVAPDSGRVSLGFLHSVGENVVPRLLAQYAHNAPHVTFDLLGAAAGSLEDALRHGALDVILTAPQPQGEDLVWIPLLREPLCLIVQDSHPLAVKEKVSLPRILKEPVLTLRPEFGLRQVTEAMFRHADLDPSFAMESTEISTLRALVRAGLGVAVVPERKAHMASGLAQVEINSPNAFRIIGASALRNPKAPRVVTRFLSFLTATSTHTYHA